MHFEDDPVFLGKLCDALIPHIGPEDERQLRFWLREAIKAQHCVSASVRDFLDTLWSKTLSTHSNEVQMIKDLYKGINDDKPDDASLIIAIIHTGIARHINVMLDLINDPSHMHRLDRYTKSKLLEWAISTKMTIDTILALRHINDENDLSAQKCYDEREFFTSKITKLSQKPPKSIEESIVPKILEKMEDCVRSGSTNEKQDAVAWLLSEICKAVEEKYPDVKCEPILTGSATEGTQALYIDEFDYVLLTNSTFRLSSFEAIFNSKILEMTRKLQHPRLALKSMTLDTNRIIRVYILHG